MYKNSPAFGYKRGKLDKTERFTIDIVDGFQSLGCFRIGGDYDVVALVGEADSEIEIFLKTSKGVDHLSFVFPRLAYIQYEGCRAVGGVVSVGWEDVWRGLDVLEDFFRGKFLFSFFNYPFLPWRYFKVLVAFIVF